MAALTIPALHRSHRGRAEARELADRLGEAKAVLGELAIEDAPLGTRTTYRVGGPAALAVVIEEDRHIDRLVEAAIASGLPTLAVGKGSNLLVADAGFAGLAVLLGERYCSASFPKAGEDAGEVLAGAGLALPVLARQSAAQGWRGLEWAVGIPGSVGGAVKMNAGGHGSDTSAHILGAEIVDLEGGGREQWPAPRLGLGLRDSALGPQHLVIGARLAVRRGDAAAAGAEVEEIVRWRRQNQPGGRNAGSVFKNPPGDFAGRLVEEAGCKGMRIGGAEVSPKHANFIVAGKDACAGDVAALIAAVAARVEQRCGVVLHPEVHLVGFEEDFVASLYGRRGR